MIKGVWAEARESDKAVDAAAGTVGGVGMACSCVVSAFTKSGDSEGWITGLRAAPSKSSPSNSFHNDSFANEVVEIEVGHIRGYDRAFFAPGAHGENALPERVYV
jgi:hypothetical protein